MRWLTGLVLITGCGAAPSPEVVASSPASSLTPTTAAPPLPALPTTLVAASNELAEALRSAEPIRSQRIARARSVIESIVGRHAERVGPGNLGRTVCALEPTILAVGGVDRAPIPGGWLITHDDATLRFDPELHAVAPVSQGAPSDDPPGVEPSRFKWVGRRLVDVALDRVAVEVCDGFVLPARSGRLRAFCGSDEGAELRSLPSGKLLFRHEQGTPFVDDVAGVAGVLDVNYGQGKPFLVIHDLDTGRELRRLDDVPASFNFPTNVTIAADGRTLAIDTIASLTWIERSGRRVSLKLGDGSSFDAMADGPYFTLDGKRACANVASSPVFLPTSPPPDAQRVCAFSQPTPHHRDAVIATLKPDPPWQILRGLAQVTGNFAHPLGASAATNDGQRVAVIEIAKPIEAWHGEARIRLADAKTGVTIRTWNLSDRSLYDMELRFVDGDTALVLDGGASRFELAPGAPASSKAVSPPVAERDPCGATGWDPTRQSSCAIGPVVGPAELCEGIDQRSAQQRKPVE